MARSGRSAVARSNRSIPLMPGRRWSDTIASTTVVSTRSSAASPLAASTAWQPARSRTRPSRARTDDSSSHTRTTGGAASPSRWLARRAATVGGRVPRVSRAVVVEHGELDHRPAPGAGRDRQPEGLRGRRFSLPTARRPDPQASVGRRPTQGLDRLDQRRRHRTAQRGRVACGLGEVVRAGATSTSTPVSGYAASSSMPRSSGSIAIGRADGGRVRASSSSVDTIR